MIEKLGPYKIDKLLGRGGMGTVYRGVHEESSNVAAIKVLTPALLDDEGFRNRFEAEVETLKRLRHPNIVELYGYGQEKDHLFYAMELVDGTSLQDELAAGRRFSWREVVEYGIDISNALRHAHDHGVVHRDLKPANLLLGPDGHIKLTDFGIAKLFGHHQLTAAGGVLGTADFMAPEQADGRAATPRSDLYSLGCVLYALLAGRPPFVGKSVPEVVHMVRFERPTPVNRLVRDVPRQLREIIEKLLEKDPQRRIPTPLALTNRLKALRDSMNVAPGADSEVDPVSSSINREPPSSVDTTSIKPSFDPSLAGQETASLPIDSSAPNGSQLKQVIDTTSPNVARAAEQPDSASLGPATVSSTETTPHSESPATFITIEDEERHSENGAATDFNHSTNWVSAGVLSIAVVVLVGIAVLLLRPPSANQLYQDILSIKASNDSGAVSKCRQLCRQFLAEYPDDDRVAEVRSIRSECDLLIHERRLVLHARRTDTFDDLSPIDQLLVEAIRMEETSPEEALALFSSILDLFVESDSSDTTATGVQLAKRRIRELRPRFQSYIQSHSKTIRDRLLVAEELIEQDPKAAERIYDAIIGVYGDSTWARKYVQQARDALAQLRATSRSSGTEVERD